MDSQNISPAVQRLLTRRVKLIIALVLVAAIAIAGVFVYARARQSKMAAEYDALMRAGLSDVPSLAFMEGNALVAYDDAKGLYTDLYVPAGLLAADPAQVRAVIHYAYGEEDVGRYDLGGTAYKRTVRVSIRDAVTGETFPHADTIIRGGDPPRVVSAFSGNQYGSAPDASEVTRWVESTWRALAYHRMMAQAFSYGLPRAYGLGDKLVVLWNGEFTTTLLPDDLAASTPEEVGAFVKRVSKMNIGYTAHTLTFVSPETGEAIEGMEKQFILDDRVYLTASSGWSKVAAEMTEWIAQTWAEYRQENDK